MNKKAIWAIVILMSSALIGIAIIQFLWIKWQVDLQKESFESNARTVLFRVKNKLHDEASIDKIDILPINEKYKSFSSKNKTLDNIMKSIQDRPVDEWKKKQWAREISSAQKRNIDDKLESINKDKLNQFIKEELNDLAIDIVYDYGVFSNKSQNFIIINDNYVAGVSGNASNVDLDENTGLYNSPYTISLFSKNGESPGSFVMYYPNKTGWLWGNVWPSMLASLLFTGLILFCFIYTIYVILRQKKVSEMKSDFINNMTHEFKTPIATISLATDSILNPIIIDNKDKIKRFAGIIKEENKRMLNQVEKVLQVARIDKKDFKLKLVKVNIHELIETAVRNTSLKIEKRQGSISCDLIAINHVVEGDQNHISNIIHNLLDNAEKYSDGNPEIKVSSRNVKDGIEFSISDNGIGMPKEALKNIFDKFYRVHTGNRHDVKGFGLGLSYVKDLVVAHKGTVNVKSELNKGSSFTIYLPFKQ